MATFTRFAPEISLDSAILSVDYIEAEVPTEQRYSPAWTQNILFLHFREPYDVELLGGAVLEGKESGVAGFMSYPAKGVPSIIRQKSLNIDINPQFLYRLLGPRFRLMTNNIVPAEKIFPEIGVLRARLHPELQNSRVFQEAHGFFEEFYAGTTAEEPRYPWVLEALNPTWTHRNLKSHFNALPVSERHARRVFRQEVGLSPNVFVRIRRMEEVLKQFYRNPDPKSLRKAFGFYDQAHLTREFREFTGKTPAHLLADFREMGNRIIHGNLADPPGP